MPIKSPKESPKNLLTKTTKSLNELPQKSPTKLFMEGSIKSSIIKPTDFPKSPVEVFIKSPERYSPTESPLISQSKFLKNTPTNPQENLPTKTLSKEQSQELQDKTTIQNSPKISPANENIIEETITLNTNEDDETTLKFPIDFTTEKSSKKRIEVVQVSPKAETSKNKVINPIRTNENEENIKQMNFKDKTTLSFKLSNAKKDIETTQKLPMEFTTEKSSVIRNEVVQVSPQAETLKNELVNPIIVNENEKNSNEMNYKSSNDNDEVTTHSKTSVTNDITDVIVTDIEAQKMQDEPHQTVTTPKNKAVHQGIII